MKKEELYELKINDYIIYVFKITIPGVAINYESRYEEDFNSLLSCMESQFLEANVALNEYTKDKTQLDNIMDIPPSQVRRIYEQRSEEILEELASAPETKAYSSQAKESLAEDLLEKEIWTKNGGPNNFINRTVEMNAKAFIYAFDVFGKCLKSMNNLDKNEVRKNIYTDFINMFPDLIEIRNSAHHLEDRVIRKQKFGKDIDLKHDPIYERAMVICGFTGDTFEMRLANGELGRIAITIDSMKNLFDIFNRVLNSFSWHGPQRTSPRLDI